MPLLRIKQDDGTWLEVLGAGGPVPLPIDKGGTGATTAEEARNNLDAAPTEHTHALASINADGFMSANEHMKLAELQNVVMGTTNTAADVAAKVVTLSNPNTGWTLYTGALIAVGSTYTNTAANPTFNINNTGAKQVVYNGKAITAANADKAGYAETYSLYMYNGGVYVYMGGGYIPETIISTTDLTEGSSTLATGSVYYVYE